MLDVQYAYSRNPLWRSAVLGSRVQEPLRYPNPGEIRIKVQSAGVALADIMRREGVYPMSPRPSFTPGYDAIGVVDEVGDAVTAFRIGDRVGVFYDGIGGYAAYIYATKEEVFRGAC